MKIWGRGGGGEGREGEEGGGEGRERGREGWQGKAVSFPPA